MQLDFNQDPNLLKTIVNEMPAGIFTVDRQGNFVAWSRGAERITGYSAEELIGQPCRLLEGENCRGFSAIHDLLEMQEPTADVCSQECRLMHRQGAPLHLMGNVRLLFDDLDRVAGAVGTFTDVTPVVLANETIELLQRREGVDQAFEQMIGTGPLMNEVFRRLQLAADSDVTVLLTGESGTGKELAAKAIHSLSSRSDGPFMALNCSALSESLLESELFGHTEGAFTGAQKNKIGVFEAAHGGTLFLDEIGELSPAIQVKLLRVLQERQIQRVGDPYPREVNVRIVTATHRDLSELLASGAMREDFYYRIRVFEIRLPPLRERTEDIPALADEFVKQICSKAGRSVKGMTREARETMLHYHWPGNVRQLRNAVEHACVTLSGDRIGYLDLPPEIRAPSRKSASRSLAGFSGGELDERIRIVEALRQTGGNRTKAAAMLGVSRVTLWKKMSRYDIELKR